MWRYTLEYNGSAARLQPPLTSEDEGLVRPHLVAPLRQTTGRKKLELKHKRDETFGSHARG